MTLEIRFFDYSFAMFLKINVNEMGNKQAFLN